ncbi:MAG: hypothetical protein GF364_13330 [Candidatus Lokiarchaeota archaeon]|nr:hypothetical protein [Candidatus Lokiarchaeota archaeon]
MDAEQFKQAKNIPQYDVFMETVLGFDGLTMDDYKDFMEKAFMAVFGSKDKDPIEIYEKAIEKLRIQWTASDDLPFHGPWHHGMVPAILMQAIKNSGYNIEDWQIHEAFQRGMKIPGGGCGFCGICGAASGLGIVLSLVQKSNPFTGGARKKALSGASKAIERVAKVGGVRCCRLSTYLTVDMAVNELKNFEIELPDHGVNARCTVFKRNPDCHGDKCPYYPKD